jgi:hypothetical protein
VVAGGFHLVPEMQWVYGILHIHEALNSLYVTEMEEFAMDYTGLNTKANYSQETSV